MKTPKLNWTTQTSKEGYRILSLFCFEKWYYVEEYDRCSDGSCLRYQHRKLASLPPVFIYRTLIFDTAVEAQLAVEALLLAEAQKLITQMLK